MKTLSWLISLTVHGLVLLIGSLSLKQAVVGIAPGRNSIEVNLVAAPNAPASLPVTPLPVEAEEPVPALQTPLPPLAEITPPPIPVESLPSPEMLPPMPQTKATTPSSLVAPALFKPSSSSNKSSRKLSHNSAPNNDKNAVTARSLAGAIIDEEPDYLSNPAPIYPQTARDDGQEGLVILDVIVKTDGSAETVKISTGSGYYLLDDAAREAVQHYRFQPATIGSIKVQSHVKVPIRFRLDQ